MFSVIPVSTKRMDRRFSTDHSRAVAIRALGFITGNRSYLDRFVSDAGIAQADLCRQPTSPALLVAILDFVINNELVLLRFARTADLPLEATYEARRILGARASVDREDRPIWQTKTMNGMTLQTKVGPGS